jgi:hypothetical protein
MVANGGIIGKVITTNTATAVGVYDTFDQYNGRRKDSWPSTPPYATVTPSVSSVNEGGSVSFTVNATNFPNGTLYWTISAISGTITAGDFSGGLSGTVSISSGVGTINLTVAADTWDEGTEIFVLNVRLTSSAGTIIGTSSQVTINDTSTGGGSEPLALYEFTTVTFAAAVTGATGPTLAQAQGAMTGTPTPSAWNTNAGYFTVTSGIQLWTVPATATYRILAAGASGLPSSSTTNRGASIRGDFSLTQGQKLRIVVGQTSTGSGTGGGGGSYVIKETGSTNADIYVIAGGGGGKSGGAGGTATNANSSNSVSNGNGGFGTSSSWGGPSGGGFFTSGANNTGSQPGGSPGAGFLQGSAGGTGGSAPGGFGGGGAGGQDSGAGGGCGGGYSGGSSGGDGSSGQGAGSYPNGANQSNTANSQAGGGLVTITKL